MAYPITIDSFTLKVDNVTDYMAADINDLQVAIAAIEAKLGIDSSGVAASIDYKVNNWFVTGRRVWLGEDTAPTGWTIDATAADGLLAVKGGAAAYNVAGGTRAGTWTQPAHSHSAGSLTGPSHHHSTTIPYSGWGYNSTFQAGFLLSGRVTAGWGEVGWINSRVLESTSAGTDAVGGSTATDGTVSTWRPLANTGIMITKN
jgi:hypothetical protein